MSESNRFDFWFAFACAFVMGATLGAGVTSGWHDEETATFRAEAVQRGYARWEHPDGKREAEFVWNEIP